MISSYLWDLSGICWLIPKGRYLWDLLGNKATLPQLWTKVEKKIIYLCPWVISVVPYYCVKVYGDKGGKDDSLMMM